MSQPEDDVQVPSYAAPATRPQPGEAQPEKPAELGPIGRLTGTLISPGETFADISRKPTFIIPIVISILLSAGGYYFYVWRANPNMDAMISNQLRKRAERSGQTLSAEDLQRQVEMGKKITRITTPIFLVAGPPIVILILAAIFALAMILIQSRTTFLKILSVVAWVFASVGLIGFVVFAATLMVQDKETLSALDPSKLSSVVPTNLGAFIETGSPALRSLLSWIDIFTFWRLILLSIGLASVAGSRKVTSGKTGSIVFGLWALLVLASMGLASVFG